jgi:drug/metabolite transporter (DMT)-like permease
VLLQLAQTHAYSSKNDVFFCVFLCLFLPSLISLYFSNFFKEFSFTKENMIGLGFVATLSVLGTGLAMMLQYRLMSF